MPATISERQQLANLRSLLARLSETVGPQERFRILSSAIEELLTPIRPRCRILVPTPDHVGLMIAFASRDGDELRGARYPPRFGLTDWVIRERKPLVLNFDKPEGPPAFASVLRAGYSESFRSVLAIPVKRVSSLLGVVAIDSVIPNAFDAELIEMLQPYIDTLAIVLEAPEASGSDDIIANLTRLRAKTVLVLGKDSGPEFALLVKISDMLAGLGYRPRFAKGLPDIPELSNEEKVRVLADMSRFVVVENSFPAGQIAECKMCAINRIVTATLRERGKGSSYMVTDYDVDYGFIKEFEYDGSDDHLHDVVKSAVTWAEAKVSERAAYFDDKYPWRKGGDT